MADEVESRKRLARLIMGQALRSWMTSVDESTSASDISAVEGGGNLRTVGQTSKGQEAWELDQLNPQPK